MKLGCESHRVSHRPNLYKMGQRDSGKIGRLIGYMLDAFPGTKLMNYGHKTGTAQ